MKIVHYSRSGYNGYFTYTSVCGKEVHTHEDKDEINVHPDESNCEECLKSKEYILDLDALHSVSTEIKRRIYIESDILHANEFRNAQRKVLDFAKNKGLK